ncbi:elongation factor G [Falsiroseomonas sp. E2-1-a20]|uniref:elongation factor G n=1 Tax=Falsiroseomonas sp. E2-1-a20 TaxID=3239300 RepID=UPI003F3A6AC6
MSKIVCNGPLASARSFALIGPQGGGKTTLFYALLDATTDTPLRRPSSAGLETEFRLGHGSLLHDTWAILDCPGSVEFTYDVQCALAVVDLAVVVCTPAPERAVTLGPLFRNLEETGTPTLIFINKLDASAGAIRDTLAALQAQTRRRLVLRQVPIREGGDIIGYVDIISRRAYRYRSGAPSERIDLPEGMQAREAEARDALLDVLADQDDALLEKVVENAPLMPIDLYRPLHSGEASGAVVSVLLGAAEYRGGVQRLWKALRHDVPAPAETAARKGIAADGAPLAQVFRTLHTGHAGRLSFVRVWRGLLKEGSALDGLRIGPISQFPRGEAHKVPQAQMGDLVAVGRLEGVQTGATLGGPALPFPAPPPSQHAIAIIPDDRKDEVRLSVALQRLTEEDPALGVSQDPQSGTTILSGQGEIHVRTALDRLARAAGVKLQTGPAPIAFRETIGHSVVQSTRLKRQTGGHGQFADVKLQIAPRPRGAGFHFDEKVVGGAVPKRFVPAIAQAAQEATHKGPLGHPVVDISVTLLDGAFHAVDSSEMAFATATRMAMLEGLAKAAPVLLEPIDEVTVSVPASCTPAAQRLLTGRRGQVLGYVARPGWAGWDDVQALLPAAELVGFIVELRSQTQGLGTYTRRFDHLAEARRC